MHKLILNVYMPDAEALDAFNQMQARATNALVRSPGGADQSNSYCRLEDENGNVIEQWHVDDFGIVRDGEPDQSDPPAWIEPTGGHDAYPEQRVDGEPVRVTHNGQVWVNTHTGQPNSWEPGQFAGWEAE